jgi:hypothetical protein
MPQEPNDVGSHRLTRLAEKMHDKEYRDGYVAAHTRQVLAKQMREFRGAKPQTEFAELIDKRQTMVSRLENPSYVGWTLSTMLEIASKLNVAVFARFVDFPTFLKYSGEQSEPALHPEAYDQQKVDNFAQAEAEQEAFQDLQINFNNPLLAPDTPTFDDVLGAQLGAGLQINWNIPYGYVRLNTPNALMFPSSIAYFGAEANQVAVLRRDLAIRDQTVAQLRNAKQQVEAENKRLREALFAQLPNGVMNNAPPIKGEPIPIGTQQTFGLSQ